MRAEMPPGVFLCLSNDVHSKLWEYGGCVEERPVVLAAIETMANPDPVWRPLRHKSNVAAGAAACDLIHGHLSRSVHLQLMAKFDLGFDLISVAIFRYICSRG